MPMNAAPEQPARPAALHLAVAIFILLGILFIPFPFHLFPYQQAITDALFGSLIRLASGVFYGEALQHTEVHSDSASMYMLLFLLLLLSIVAATVIRFFMKPAGFQTRFLQWIGILAVYYLALMLMKYGLDKVFKHQFYLPEPNILYTPVGQVDKDLLYWSSMGTSRLYNVFAGGLEVLAALLLFFSRTRMAGGLLAMAILFQVLMINLGFDISVKMYSSFLLLLSLYILSPYLVRLCRFFSGGQVVPPATPVPKVLGGNPFAYVFSKCLLTGLILLESFYPYLRTGNFNDDLAARPRMHGAYEVKQYISGADTITGSRLPVRRFFIHRNGYLIFQDQQDAMQDYKLEAGPGGRYYITNYLKQQTPLDIDFRESDSVLTIRYQQEGVLNTITGKGLNWRELPLMKKLFHWKVE